MKSFWETIFFDNSVRDWAIAGGIILLAFLASRILQTIVLKRIQHLASKTISNLDDFVIILLQRSVMPFLYIFSFYCGLKYLALPSPIERILHTAMLVITVFFTIKIIASISSYMFQQFTTNTGKDASQMKQAKGILLIIKIVLWTIGIIFLVDNLGYDITTIITGLGIGGIAIALAAQAILGDLFSYLVIFFDKPFETGDFIVIGDKSGTVEYIGIKTTRLRTLSGEQLVVSNTDLTNSRVQNFKRMEKRRILFSIGVTYETNAEKLKKIPLIVREIIESQDGALFERTHFSGFGDFSLNFEIVYYVLTADYLQYMDSQQAVCLELFQRFEKENIDFAYPTQKLYLTNAINSLKNEAFN